MGDLVPFVRSTNHEEDEGKCATGRLLEIFLPKLPLPVLYRYVIRQ